MNLYPHQAELLALNPDRYLLAHGTGSGKTLMAIELAKKRNERILVICPKTLKQKWLRDVATIAMVYTKEEFKKAEPSMRYYPTVIVDEAHAFFGPTSQLHKSLVRYFKRYNTPFRYFLTATPYLSTPWNIYAAGIVMGLPLNYQKFRQTFFSEIRMGHRYVWKAKEDKESKAKLKALVNKMGSSIQLEDVFEVPTQEHEVFLLEPSELQLKAIAEAYDPVPIVQWTAEHRIENTLGPKVEWIKEFAKTHDKFVVWCRYISQLEEYKYVLRSKYTVLEIHGGVTDRDAVIATANKSKKVILLIQASCSEGFELPSFNTAVYASLSFSYKDLVQSQGRLLRANALHENHYYYLVIKGGVDEEVYKTLQKREDFSIELLQFSRLQAQRQKPLSPSPRRRG